MRALEREAKAQRELLESYLAKYREATARENIDAAPAEARIISRAIVSNTASFPKKLPIVLVATLAMFVFSAGLVTTGELLGSTHGRAASAAPLPVARAREEFPGIPPLPDTHPAVGVPIRAIDDVARALRAAGEGGRRVTVLGSKRSIGTTLAAITLARTLVKDARVVLVDLALGGRATFSDLHGSGRARHCRRGAGHGILRPHHRPRQTLRRSSHRGGACRPERRDPQLTPPDHDARRAGHGV